MREGVLVLMVVMVLHSGVGGHRVRVCTGVVLHACAIVDRIAVRLRGHDAGVVGAAPRRFVVA